MANRAKTAERPPVGIIGAGAMGTALARRLAARGYRIHSVVSRTEAHARRLAAAVAAPHAGTDPSALPGDARLVFCCVPDDALPALAEQLFAAARNWDGTVVAHTSGVRTANVFALLAARGAAPLSFHPVQTFPPGSPPDAFAGIYIGLEGSPQGLAVGRTVAEALGAHAVVIPTEAKAHYHLAAAIASNFFVVLMAVAQEVLAPTGLPRPQRAALLHPLVAGTLRNLADGLPEDVLTGPVVRGDAETVVAHAQALDDGLAHLKPLFATLVTESVRVAVRGRRLASPDAEALLDAVYEALNL